VKKRKYIDYLDDILEALLNIENFTFGMNIAAFQKDKKTIYAVIRCIEVIGEASLKVPNLIKEKYARVPWIQMSGMRPKIMPEYFEVDIDILWQTVREDIPILRSYMQDIKLEIKGDSHSSQASSTVS
jgi:uncharacterized protein with HEPN domain